MGHIARCPACATMFRVAAEQLEVAHGWVRCGQCGEVFDAGLHLLPAQAVLPEKSLALQASEASSDVSPSGDSLVLVSADVNQLPEPLPVSDHAAATTVPEQPEMAAAAMGEPESLPEVDFVRESIQSNFWHLPLVRAALSLACLVLFAGLLLQLIVGQKDVLAAQDPRLAPSLQAVCQLLGCEVRPLRRIESLVIEQASFSKTGLDTYRLSFVFRNTGNAAVEIPALEVTLTDSQDQAVVRRVIMPAQFAASAVTLAAHTEMTGALSINVVGAGNQPAAPAVPAVSTTASGLPAVASYRILAFYP